MFKNLSSKQLGLSGSQSELIELALSFGFKGLDLDIVEFAEQVASKGLPHARRLLDSSKLQVGAFALPTRWQGDDETFKEDLAKVPTWAAVAGEAGYRRAVTVIDPASDERPFHQNFELAKRRLNDLGKALEPHGIRLGVGFSADASLRKDRSFEFIHGLDTLLLLFSSVSARNVGMVVDLFDLHVAGGSIEDLRKVGAARLVGVLLADAPTETPAQQCLPAQRLLPGETGAIDSTAALVLLAELGYDGPVTPTAHPDQLKGLRREAAVKRVGEAMDRVWKAAGLNALGKLSSLGKLASPAKSMKS
ncbi:MAG TPA: sugar phosphate isomerase/epimerase [Pirellulales bacterium]|jgi:sugar phosphate isomerase/epimerase